MNRTSKTNLLFLITIVVYVGMSNVVGILFARNGFTEMPIWLNVAISQLLIFLPMCGFLLINKESPFKLIHYKKIRISDVLICVLFAILMIPIVLCINMISMMFVQNQLQTSVAGIYSYPFWAQVLVLAVTPAVFEEFAFRGVFFHSYRKNNIFGAAILSGVLFGLIHMNFNQFAYAFVLGIVFAFLVEAVGSIWGSMIAHFVINMNSVLSMALLSFVEKMAGNTTSVDTMVSESQNLYSSLPTYVMIIYIVIFAGMAAISGVLAFLVYMWLAKRNGRWEHVKSIVKDHPFKKKEERFMDVFLILAIVACVAYMVMVEIV